MGVTLHSKDEMEDLSMSYGSFNELREHIALVYDKEWGKGYKEYNDFFRYLQCPPAYCEKKFNSLQEMAKQKHLKASIFNFFWKSDCDGNLSKTACKDLYELLKDTENNYWCWEEFKELLKYCVENNQGVIWL